MTMMPTPLAGLHHVTAVTGRVQDNLRFYTRVLGLRLVKKTVNQDALSAYHLFYADTQGNPGTEVTFFDWPHLPPNQPGHGEIATVALRVGSTQALDWWADWLAEQGVRLVARGHYAEHAAIWFSDPEGQRFALVDDRGVPGGEPWERGGIPREYAIKGLFGVTMVVRALDRTLWVLTEVLGFRERARDSDNWARRVILECGSGGPGAVVVVEERPDLPRAQLGTGGVHHVAFRVPDDATHRAWRQHIVRMGIPVTPPIDRYYFRSLYFREPGGILYELATDGPGFAIDEDPEHLGEKLSLPPFLEPRRAEIEALLRPLELTLP